MCKIYNTIGCLTTIKDHLNHHNIHDFQSLNDVIEFQKSYFNYRQQIIIQHEKFIEKEKDELFLDLKHLDELIERNKLNIEEELTKRIDNLRQNLNIVTNTIRTNLLERFIRFIKLVYFKIQIQYNLSKFESRVNRSLKNLINLRQQKNNRYQFIISHFNDAVTISCKRPLTTLDRKKSIIDEVATYIAGAIGEHCVVKELQKLSDEYQLINDFSISFSKPIYNRQENDSIKSVQIDHILIGPSGIFLIETKNWSAESLKNLNLRSPVQQIKRTSFVLYKLLNNEITRFLLENHRWGEKKISIRNLIVLINSKPKEEFQYVKILTLSELLGYVKYFKASFSNIETQRITDYLLKINNKGKF
ncbi:MAG: NERD domain-containing protein [Bacteroidetes bacterium]|nr:NERD domain-containing protein [Bacteroidota bacterium]